MKHKRTIAASIGVLLGGVIATSIGKAIMEFGIALVTGVAVVGAGFLIGVLTFPVKLMRSR